MSKSFKQQLANEMDAIVSGVNSAMTNTLTQGLGFVTTRAAVITGRYRAAWNIATDRPLELVPTLKKKHAGHKAGADLYGLRPQHVLFDLTRNRSIMLTNNVEYAEGVDAKYGDVLATRKVMESSLRARLKRI